MIVNISQSFSLISTVWTQETISTNVSNYQVDLWNCSVYYIISKNIGCVPTLLTFTNSWLCVLGLAVLFVMKFVKSFK